MKLVRVARAGLPGPAGVPSHRAAPPSAQACLQRDPPLLPYYPTLFVAVALSAPSRVSACLLVPGTFALACFSACVCVCVCMCAYTCATLQWTPTAAWP
jgi:hypothetical protein